MRPGELGLELYAWGCQMSTPAICPAVSLTLVTSLGIESTRPQSPDDTGQFPPVGLGVFSFVPPAHHRGPLYVEPAGIPLASARPQRFVLNVPGSVKVTCPKSENVLLPPNRAALAESTAVASNAAAMVVSVVDPPNFCAG